MSNSKKSVSSEPKPRNFTNFSPKFDRKILVGICLDKRDNKHQIK